MISDFLVLVEVFSKLNELLVGASLFPGAAKATLRSKEPSRGTHPSRFHPVCEAERNTSGTDPNPKEKPAVVDY